MLAQVVMFLMCTDEVLGLTLGYCHNRVFIVLLTAQASVMNTMTTLFLVHDARIVLPLRVV
jgi:hypothetical protein